MKILAAKAAVDKEWEKLEKISAWNLTKVKSKKQVIDEARTSGATVHSLFLFLSLFFFSFSLCFSLYHGTRPNEHNTRAVDDMHKSRSVDQSVSRIFQIGKLHTKDVLENHFMDRLFHLVHWLSITL